jgi:hypothetical protein
MDASITSPRHSALLTSLQERHRRLLAQNMSGRATAEDRANLVRDTIASGSKIPDGAARDTLRNIVYFWVADQIARGERPRTEAPPALDPFAGLAGGDRSTRDRMMPFAWTPIHHFARIGLSEEEATQKGSSNLPGADTHCIHTARPGALGNAMPSHRGDRQGPPNLRSR